jgi:hypothetical protein
MKKQHASQRRYTGTFSAPSAFLPVKFAKVSFPRQGTIGNDLSPPRPKVAQRFWGDARPRSRASADAESSASSNSRFRASIPSQRQGAKREPGDYAYGRLTLPSLLSVLGGEAHLPTPTLPSTKPAIWKRRRTARRPKCAGSIARRGPTAGLPKTNQTDPRRNLSWEDMCAARNAEAFATASNLPLTAHITVDWRTAPGFVGTSAASWEAEHRHFTRRLNSWLKRRDVRVAHLYVRERCVGRGSHTHFMVHIPPLRWQELKQPLEDFLEGVLKARGYTDANLVKITGDAWKTNGMVHETQRRGLLRYLGKAMNPDEVINDGLGLTKLSDFLGIWTEAQASVPCKRVGWTQNIGEKARRTAAWDEIRDVLRLAQAPPDRARAKSGAGI